MSKQTTSFSKLDFETAFDTESEAPSKTSGHTPTGSMAANEVAILRERNSALVDRISKLRVLNQALSTAAEISTNQDVEIKELRDLEADLKSEISRLTDVCDTQKKKIEEDKRAIEKLQTQLREEEDHMKFFARHSQRQLDDLAQEKDAELLERKKSEENLVKQVSALKAECQTLEEEIAIREEGLKRLQSAIAAQQELLAKTEGKYEATLAHQAELFARTRAEIEAKLFEQASLAEKAQKALEAKIAQENERSKEGRFSDERTKEDYNRKLARMSDETWNKDLEIQRLRTEESALNKEIARLNAEISSQTQALVEANRTIQDLRRDLNKAQTETATEIKFMRAENENKISELMKALTDRSSSASGARSEFAEEINRLRTECHDYRLQLQAAQEQANSLRSTIANQQLELHHVRMDSERQVASLKTEHMIEIRAKEADQKRLETDYSLQLRSKQAEIEGAEQASERKIMRAHQQFELETEKFRAVESRLAAEILALKNERAAQVAVIKETKKTITQLEKAFEEQKESSFKLDTQLTIAGEELRRKTERLTQLETQVENQSRFLVDRQRAIMELEMAEKALRQTAEEHKRHAAEAKAIAADLQEELKEVSASFEERKRLSGELETETTALRQALEDQKRQTAEVKTAAFELERRLRAQNKELETKLQEQSTLLDEKKKEVVTFEIELFSLRQSFEDQRKQTTEARAQASDLKAKVDEQGALLEERKKASVDLELEVVGLRKTLEKSTVDFKSEIEGLRKSHEKSTIGFESEVEALRKQVKTYKSQAEAAQAEATKLSQALSQATQSRDFAAKAERERLEVWSTQLSARESQLRSYSTALTKEKSEVLHFSKQIAAEIEMISRTHPLRDYLKVTEFELSKVEVQLKTMPTMAPERTRLEAAINQLVEQREFLRSILAGAEKHFEQQVKNLEKLHQGAKMAPVPPPPPAKVEAATPARVATQKAPLEDVRVQWESPVKDLE